MVLGKGVVETKLPRKRFSSTDVQAHIACVAPAAGNCACTMLYVVVSSF
jgi:hypothetical protein